jgi:hypothetical protein
VHGVASALLLLVGGGDTSFKNRILTTDDERLGRGG